MLLLALILVAGARLLWGLGDKTLWWDESLSLQRAESAWPLLLLGRLQMTDGVNVLYTQDQHPFLFFALLKPVIAGAGISEYALRILSAWAGTAMVPLLWALARRLERRSILPPGSGLWAAGLAAVSPFYLWYGQEARSYMLWAALAVLSTYCLVVWVEAAGAGRPLLSRVTLAYLGSLALLLATHYHSVLLVGVHGLVVVLGLGRARPGLAWTVAGLVGVMGAGVAGAVAWVLLRQPGIGENFARVAWWILARDLLNAFSMGLSVDLRQVWPLDVLAGLLALAGGVWSLGRARRDGLAWLPVVFLLGPVLLLFVGNRWQPLYMNARHLALVSGAFLLLVAGGLAWLSRRWWPAAGMVAGLLLVGVGVSSVQYFTLPTYAKGPDLRGLAADLRRDLHPGDLLLVEPPFAWRLFRYYLPLAEIEAAAAAGTPVGWRAVPLIQQGTWDWEGTWAALDGWSLMEFGESLDVPPDAYRRIWLVREGTHPYIDPDEKVWRWLREHLFLVWQRSYFSPNAYLSLDTFITRVPGRVAVPPSAEKPPVVFGDLIALRGWKLGRPLWEGANTPLTVYWDVLHPPQQRYKYILWLEAEYPDGSRESFPRTEQEPFRTFIPTSWWQPGPVIEEETDLVAPFRPDPSARYWLHVVWYHAETLERLPITQASGYQVRADGTEAVVPLEFPE